MEQSRSETRKRWSQAGWIAAGLRVSLSILVLGGMAAERMFGGDSWITTKTKIALITSEDVHAMDVNVDTVEGMVTLHGKVQSEQAKQTATSVSREIEGVRSVRNFLQVVPPPALDEVEAGDAAIATQVEEAIERDAALKDSDIEVESVNDGVVLLGGHASSLTAHLDALDVAGKVPGVRRVASEITTESRLYDEGIWNEGAVEQKGDAAADEVREAGHETAEVTRDAGTKAKDAVEDAGAEIADAAKKVGAASSDAVAVVGNAVKDIWITSETKAKLVADVAVSAMDVNVDTRDGVVTLFGTVESMEAKAAAEQDARSVGGVRDVRNEIIVAIDEEREVN